MDCSHVGSGGYSGDRDTQMSEHEVNSTWSGRGSEEHDWSGQEEEEFRQENHSENRSSYLGYNGMGHYDNEGLSEITKGKGKGKKGTDNFRAIATHVARGVTKQLTANHRAKEKMEQDGIKATKAKDQAKVEQRDSPKAKAKE